MSSLQNILIMSSLNKVQLIGHLGKDPEIRNLDSQVKVANFSIATSEYYMNRNNEKVQVTEWHRVVVWRGLAEVVEKYVTKGMKVYVEGKLKTRSWDDREGKKHYVTEVHADNLIMLSNNRQENSQQPHATADNVPSNEFQPQEDDLPF